LGTADLKLGTVILPRNESPKAISRLTEFEWFHKIDSTNDLVTPEIDDLLLKAQQTFQSIDDVIKGMGIPLTVGIMEILFKGTVIKKKKIIGRFGKYSTFYRRIQVTQRHFGDNKEYEDGSWGIWFNEIFFYKSLCN